MLRPPLGLSRVRAAAKRASSDALAVDRDVELEDSRLDRHGRSLPSVIRPLAYAASQMERLRTLSEAECYERCYGWRYSEYTVKVLHRERDERDEPSDAGERLRMLLELRLDSREVEAA